jgi:chemotaxis family two-component system response regulator Rcp1
MPAIVLLVEDNPGDVRLMRETLGKESNIQMLVASDGFEALDMLNHRGIHARIPRPDVILLDLNLPRMDGHDFLIRLKSDKALQSIPVIVLTSSEADIDIVKSYELRASAYLCKLQELDEYDKLVKSINDLWLVSAKFPSRVSSETTIKQVLSDFTAS